MPLSNLLTKGNDSRTLASLSLNYFYLSKSIKKKRNEKEKKYQLPRSQAVVDQYANYHFPLTNTFSALSLSKRKKICDFKIKQRTKLHRSTNQ